MIRLLNPRKEEKETLTRKTKRKKVGNAITCENWGHFAKNCWYNKDKRTTKGKEEGANRARQNSDDSEDMVVMDAVTADHVDSKIWFFDSSCLNRMTSRKVWLAYFDSSRKSKVNLVDSSSLQA